MCNYTLAMCIAPSHLALDGDRRAQRSWLVDYAGIVFGGGDHGIK